jgi:hypothetical protein
MRFIITAVFALALLGCAHTRRGDIIAVRDFPSPDGSHICTVFGEIFHDTTGYDRHIYLRSAREKRGYPGNVYVVHVGDDVVVSWTSPTNLSVGLSLETRHVFPATTNVAGVKVTFFEMTK